MILELRPHLHGDLPAWLDRRVPDILEDQLSLGTLEIVVAFSNMGSKAVDVGEGLVYKVLHGLM